MNAFFLGPQTNFVMKTKMQEKLSELALVLKHFLKHIHMPTF